MQNSAQSMTVHWPSLAYGVYARRRCRRLTLASAVGAVVGESGAHANSGGYIGSLVRVVALSFEGYVLWTVTCSISKCEYGLASAYCWRRE
jgi:hypothetical protein